MFLQDPEMVRRYAVLKAERVPYFRERGSGMLVDGFVNQEADFPPEDGLSGDARVLKGREDRGRRDEG
ncbi:MAG TPA: hypothetical protein VLO07_01435, partial [Thermoanaerobaculia bacterium]|nr:hypothetical protein [Thermoanaerobaculia bacterium]